MRDPGKPFAGQEIRKSSAIDRRMIKPPRIRPHRISRTSTCMRSGTMSNDDVLLDIGADVQVLAVLYAIALVSVIAWLA